VKLVSADVVHKTERGGVLLDVDGPDAAAAACETLLARAPGPARALITPMVRGGVETVIGGVRDPQFGAVVMFGLGGVLVEALDDVVFRLAPVSIDEAHAMLDEIRGRKLLDGLRGRPAVDRAALARIVTGVSELMSGCAEIAEVDLNPVFALPDGAAVADARAVLV
jgi:hypothetical protein